MRVSQENKIKYFNIMNIMDNYICKLRFRIEKAAPEKYRTKWANDLKKNICDGGCEKNHIITRKMLSKCSLDVNKNLPLLNRSEGGIGGNCNLTNKQLRYQDFILNQYNEDYNQNDIIINVINSNVEKWSFNELDDIRKAYIKVFNNFMCEKCTIGSIEFYDPKNLYDSDCSDDSE